MLSGQREATTVAATAATPAVRATAAAKPPTDDNGAMITCALIGQIRAPDREGDASAYVPTTKRTSHSGRTRSTAASVVSRPGL